MKNLFLVLIYKILGAILLITGLSIFLFAYLQPDPLHYYQSGALKLSLLKNTPSPRIIIAGGSNVAWGIDSELIEREMGIPVINDGLDAHLGIAPLNELKNYIQPRDIIVVSLEYYNFANETDFYGVPPNLADWIEADPRRFYYLHNPVSQAPELFSILLQRKINRQLNLFLYESDLDAFRGIYTANNFNAHGDFVGHLIDEIQTQVGEDFGGYPVNQLDIAYSYLEDFNQFALSHGARVFYEAQAHREYNCQLTGMKYIRRFHAVLQTRTTIPLITNTNQLCYPDDYFYDTPYHLNETGRKIRTERLIQNLRIALEQ